VIWVLSVTTFLVAVIIYVLALYQQVGHPIGPVNPITPVTELSGLVTFFVIAYLARGSGFWVALGSAIVGTIAAPMIFELPFDLIVMWRTSPPTPEIPFPLLFAVWALCGFAYPAAPIPAALNMISKILAFAMGLVARREFIKAYSQDLRERILRAVDLSRPEPRLCSSLVSPVLRSNDIINDSVYSALPSFW
jgi:hypothetical protein